MIAIVFVVSARVIVIIVTRAVMLLACVGADFGVDPVMAIAAGLVFARAQAGVMPLQLVVCSRVPARTTPSQYEQRSYSLWSI